MNPPIDSYLNENLPFFTSDLPGIGGYIKSTPDDFQVEEIPAYLPCGSGDHLFLWIEKEGITTEQLIQKLSQIAGIPKREIGSAGLKDKQARTRQFISVPERFQERIREIESESFRILEANLHQNKLKTGHLKGNRFRILVRETSENALELAEPIRKRILESGFPNYFGSQRFGRDNQTFKTGLESLLDPDVAKKQMRNRTRFRLMLSAVQSALFNQALAERINDDLILEVLEGDVMKVVESGGVFLAEDVPVEQKRFLTGETVPTGPLFGPKMKQATGIVGEKEINHLESAGLKPDHFLQFKKLTSGTRRAFLVRPKEMQIKKESEGLRFEFELPSGVYATSLLREFIKAESSQSSGEHQ